MAEQGAMSDPNALSVSERFAEKIAALNEYWTEEALENAIPIGHEIEGAIEALTEEDLTDAEEVSAEARLPDGASFSAWDPQPSYPASGSNTERVPDRTIIPYSAVGKMFMSFQGNNYVGSAWTIAESGVFTAGHCVFDKTLGGWAEHILFIPQFHMGTRPLGGWAATQAVSLQGWTNDRDFKYDLAAFKVDRPIRPSTGSLGWLANAKPNQGAITGIGYPAASPFDGQEMWRSTGKNLGGANPIQAYNDMTPGCSGGPWEIWRGGTPLTNGVNSFRYTNNPRTMYSPYFGQGFLNIYNWTK